MLAPHRTQCTSHLCALLLAQAERVKDKLLAQRAHWLLNGPVSEHQLLGMMADDAPAESTSGTRGVALDRRRFGDDDDSDVDLDGL